MICPQCGKLIGVGEEKCPFCGAWQPSMFGAAPALQRWFGSRLDLTPMIVTACIALYVLSLALDLPAVFAGGFSLFNFLAPGSRALYQLGMTGGIAWQAGWWWTLFTAIYLHGGLLHIFFNLMWVRNLGPAVTQYYGPARAFVLFTIAGVVGFLLSNVMTSLPPPAGPLGALLSRVMIGAPGGVPTIGASGSIFGLLAALIVVARRTGHSMMTAQLWQWALIMFVMGFLMSGVNNFAHAGGFAGGWVTAQAMRMGDERRESPAVQVLAIALILFTLAGFVLSFVKVTGILLSH